MKNKKQEVLTLAILLATSFNANAFNNGDIITFDPGVIECPIPNPTICNDFGIPDVVTRGSYFALDTDGSGHFSLQERTPLVPGPDGGIVLGMLQPGPGIDQPWDFFNMPGMHQTTVTPVIQNPDGTLNFSGWEASWLDMVIPLGSGTNATVSCGGASPCTVSDPYHIDYTAMISSGPFYGVNYQLHLENIDTIPSVNVSLSIEGGYIQECASIGGHNVSATANITLLNGAQLDTIQWTVNGQDAGTGTIISPFLSLGSNTISVTATTVSGPQDTATTTVGVVDRMGPVINAAFIDNRTGTRITSIDTKNTSFVGVNMSATDICDGVPSVSGTGGFALADRDTLKIQGNLDKVELKTSVLQMSVHAVDASNNYSSMYKTLNITP